MPREIPSHHVAELRPRAKHVAQGRGSLGARQGMGRRGRSHDAARERVPQPTSAPVHAS
ncbi:hypothetical protein [Novacetimonas pomaceti]|uniref:hypothetical protein n=1 Tax=Novacetimonas pomaceti TaxID=2021998 RepID=UPI0014035C55|nr:hypothetical protein [Novacetimonas pomaceti]